MHPGSSTRWSARGRASFGLPCRGRGAAPWARRGGAVKGVEVVIVVAPARGASSGAGGGGAPSVAGVPRNVMGMSAEGAPAAVVMALVVQALFEVAERFVVPRGLRLRPAE